jgi:hypothetical protein
MKALAILLLSSTAAAAPVAKLSEDLDGDGKPEAIELGADGQLKIAAAQIKIATQPITKATLAVARGGNVQLVIDVTTAAGREAIVLDKSRGWRAVVRFPLGGVGLDREFSIEVAGGSAGVIRYQARSDIRRCDGKPAYLFAERLDGTAWKKLDKLPIDAPPNLASITARLDPATTGAPLLYQARSASHQLGATDAGGLAIPRELDDGRTDTGWREELTSAGEGQFFTFQPRVASARAQQLRIVPGSPGSRTVNRPRAVIVVGAQGAVRVEIPEGASDPRGSAYIADLPQPIAGCTTVILESAYGRPNGQTAIAELGIYAEGERTGGGEALLARVVSEGKGDTTGAAAALAKRGAPAAMAIDAELARTRDAGARRRLVGALVKIKDPAAVTSLLRAASDGWVRDKDLLDVIDALAANGQIQALRDLAGKSGLAVEIRVAAASRILPNAAGMAALVELAGEGPRPVRHAVIEQLALGPVVPLIEAATISTAAPKSGDLWRAATRHARTSSADRPAVVTAMLAALPTTGDYERRYRLVDGLAAYGDAPTLATLETFVRGLPRGAETSALRQVAVRSLAATPRADGTRFVLAFALDLDPGVRLAALSALASADMDGTTPDAIDRLLTNRLAKDHWPEIRRRAAAALGARCQRVAPARALVDAVQQDRDFDVRGDSLTALVQCNAAGVRDLLAKTWDDPKMPPPIRSRAIDLVVALGDRPLAATLVARYQRWRGQAITSSEALELAQHAAAVLGRMNPPGAAAALTDALDDSAFPEIVSSAALALGALGRACPNSAKAKLQTLARSEDRSASVARRAAAQCGK